MKERLLATKIEQLIDRKEEGDMRSILNHIKETILSKITRTENRVLYYRKKNQRTVKLLLITILYP